MARPGDINRVEVVFLDEPVEVNVGETLARIQAAMAKQPRFDVLHCYRIAQQGVIHQVQHAHTEVEACLPVRVDLASHPYLKVFL